MRLVHFLLITAFALAGCSRLILTSAVEENKMGEDAYKEVLQKEKLCTDPASVAMIQRIGERLAKAADPQGETGFKWEFVLLENDAVNAFCLPGGKVAFYTGILSFCENEAGIATVMGHEIAHATLRHGGERMTQGMLAQATQTGLAMVMQAKGYSESTTNVAVMAAGLGAQYGALLPYSRKHEYEADYTGTIFMARAGYDPNEAVKFWGRFAKLTDGGSSSGLMKSVQSFTSTHPISADRSVELQGKISEMNQLYQAATVKSGAGDAVPVKYRAMPEQKKK